jgi:predicted extracellular nuclease
MLLTTATDLTVSDVFNAVRFGEVTLSNGRLFTPTQLVLPGEAARQLSAANARNRLLLENGRTGTFRQPFIIGEDGVTEVSATNPIRNGYTLKAGYQGILGYGFNVYRLRPVGTPVYDSSSNPRTAAPQTERGNLRIANFNVENLFTTLNVSGNSCGPNALACRGATTVSELERQLAKTVSALLAIDADMVALIEVENDADDSTLQLLVERLNQLDLRADWDYVATGSVGTDAIKPAFIFRRGSLVPQGAFAVLDESADADFDTSRQRPALAQSFVTAEGAAFTAVAVHLRAKSCSSSATGADADSGDGQSCWNQWRSRAAAALGRWLATDPTGIADPDYVIMGDFNAYAKEDPMRILENAGFVNVAVLNDEPEYSYTFMGEAGSLDHAMVSNSLLSQVVAAAPWHINADEIVNFNYSEANLASNLPKPASFYNADPFRTADHDPLIVELQLQAPLSIELSLVRVNQASARSGSKLVQLRWNSPQQGLTLYRDGVAVATLSNPGMYNNQFKTQANSVIYTLCYDVTKQCSAPLVVNF